MWRSLVLSLAGPVVKALVVVAVGRAKARIAENDKLSEAEKVLANEAVDALVLELNKDLGAPATPPAA